MERVLALLFPPRFHKIEKLEYFQTACVAHNDSTQIPLTEDGIIWRGYDVRKTGVEKMQEVSHV